MASLPHAQPRAAIYVRVSTAGQEQDGTSMETQEAACRRYAAEHGYTVDEAHVYREVHTGTELWERPRLQPMREAIRRRDMEAVIAYAIDRLARDPVHLGVIISEAEHAGVQVQFVTEPLDDSPEGQLIRFVRGYAAKVEHEKIKERAMRGRRARVDRGKLLPGGRPLYGYTWRDDTRSAYDPDPLTAPIAQRIWREAAGGKTLRGIARDLDADGVPTPRRSGWWGYSTIRDLLRNPLYAGRAVAFRRVRMKNGRPGSVGTATFRPETEHVPLPNGTVPALVDRPTFEVVQRRLQFNQMHHSGRPPSDPESALLRNGYVTCGDCGSVMFVKRATDPAASSRYRCDRSGGGRRHCPSQPSIMVPLLDRAVWSRVEAILTQPALVSAELERTYADDPTDADVAAVDKRLAKITRQQSNLIDQIANVSGQAAGLLAARVEALEREREQLAAERESILKRRQAWLMARQRLDDFRDWCATVAQNLRGFTFAEKREALDALGVHVRVWPPAHTPHYRIDASIPLRRPDTERYCSTYSSAT